MSNNTSTGSDLIHRICSHCNINIITFKQLLLPSYAIVHIRNASTTFTIHNVLIIITILAVKKAGHLNIKTKRLANTVREYSLASQSERVPQGCFYVKVTCLSCGEYIIKKFLEVQIIDYPSFCRQLFL